MGASRKGNPMKSLEEARKAVEKFGAQSLERLRKIADGRFRFRLTRTTLYSAKKEKIK